MVRGAERTAAHDGYTVLVVETQESAAAVIQASKKAGVKSSVNPSAIVGVREYGIR